MVKKILILILLTFSYQFGFAQVGIGTTTPNRSSILDISSENKGILIPRVALSSTTNSSINNTSSNAQGLLIYNTNASVTGGTGQGFYYWNGLRWNILKDSDNTPPNQNWALDGNTVNNAQFLGTLNSEALNFKVNNILVGNFKPNNSLNLGAGSTSNNLRSTGIGYQATASADDATALGRNAHANNFRTAAVGFNSLASGEDSGAFGSRSEATGLKAVAGGFQALA